MLRPIQIAPQRAPRGKRTAVLAAAIAATVMASPVATAAPPDSLLAQTIAEAKRVRVTVSNGSFELTRAWVEQDGLFFRGVKGYPPRRRGLLESPDLPPPPEPPKSPLAWSDIQRIERPQRSWGPGTVPGGALGLLGGLVVGVPVGVASSYATNTPIGIVVFGGFAIGGAIIGAKAMGENQDWLEVYPERSPAIIPNDKRR